MSVLIPVKNRGGEILDHCLASLVRSFRQDGAGGREIIVSDLGSGRAAARDTRERALAHGAGYGYHPHRGEWNKGLALNLAARRARGKYLLCLDADMVVAPDFIPEVRHALARDGIRTLLLCRCRLASRGEDFGAGLREERAFRRLLRRTCWFPGQGVGGCLGFPRSWFLRTGGFDLRLHGYRGDAADLAVRAALSGMKMVSLERRTALVHQWHPRAPWAHPARKETSRRWNRPYLVRRFGKIVRNLREEGA